MADSIGVEISGVVDLVRVMRRVSTSDIGGAVRSANLAGAGIVAERSKGRAPVRTGRLKGTIRPSVTAAGGVVRMGGIAGVAYQNVIHWGRKFGNVGSPPGNHRGPNAVTGRPFIVQEAERASALIAAEHERQLAKLFARTLGG